MSSFPRPVRNRGGWVILLLLAALFIAVHLPLLSRALEDIDSVNFALGVRDFDPARHRPHPPGYPVYIGLAKLARLVLDEPRALAIWGAIFGGLAVIPLVGLFRAIGGGATERAVGRLDGPGDSRPGAANDPAVWAAVLVLVNPLFWMNASRPMSDVAGLAVTLVAQAFLVRAFAWQARAAGTRAEDLVVAVASGRSILAGALVGALALGFRSQAVWLTLPLLAVVLVDRAGRGAAGALVGSLLWYGAGILLWAVPLLVASGGPQAYFHALASQGLEDWTDADILATHFGMRRLAVGLIDTFIRPWGGPIVGSLVVGLAVAGVLVLLARNRRGLAALAGLAVPYAAFHLLFQETPHTRYALPLVPPVAYLAVVGLSVVRRLPLALAVAAIGATTLATAVPSLLVYAREGSPSARALVAINDRLAREQPEPAPALRVPQALGLAWRDEDVPLASIPTLRRRQWTALVDHWRDGRLVSVWYLAEPEASGLDNRHDLALIDPATSRLVQRFRWAFDPISLLGGVRPSDLDWYEMAPPGWMALDGWALTPRLAGLARLEGAGPVQDGTSALVRRRPVPLTVLVGGRHLGAPGDPDVRFQLVFDGTERDAWTVSARDRFFLRVSEWDAEATLGDGPFGLLTLRSRAADGSGRTVDTAIEQFDVQPSGQVMIGFDEGWHEQEYDPARGRLWRWTSERGALWIRHPGRDVVLRISGESPLRYFDAAPAIRVRAGDQPLGEFRPTSDFALEIVVPVAVLEASGGRVTIATDQTFVPDERTGNGDRRRLGLRIFDVRVEST